MTKEIQLTQGQVALVDDSDFEWLNQWKWHANKILHTFYAARNKRSLLGKRETIYMHRVIMDAPDGLEVDHEDGEGLNNQRHNLRICTTSQNQMNRAKDNDNTSGYKGVYWHKLRRKWNAQIWLNGTHQHLGYFPTAELAARAYDQAARKLHGEFANLNFPDGSGLFRVEK